ncbi:MAG: hypothetical protein B6229_07500 [Spirochaetaceae bacterium 4572_7]|nr:MAG: hypothetical protein B6229_07500 [Spirochaetaceae bacterium 4572_7]
MVNSISSPMVNIQGSSGHYSKIEVPLPSSISVYAQFKYVRGVPVSGSQKALSLSRAQVIDNMASFLNSSSEKHSLDLREEFTVPELEQEVHDFVNDIKLEFSSLPGRGADTGVIFNTSA